MSLEKLQNNLRKLEQWEKEGYQWVCFGCNTVYKQKPQELYENGHGGRFIDMCRCGSDLFGEIDYVIGLVKRQIRIKSDETTTN